MKSSLQRRNLHPNLRPELDFRREKFTKRKSEAEQQAKRPQQQQQQQQIAAHRSSLASATKPVIATRRLLILPLLLLLYLQAAPLHLLAQQPTGEYLLVGQAGQQAHLPCLIGRQLYCGEPYFIAWYKRNSSSLRDWMRIEYATGSAGDAPNDVGGSGGGDGSESSAAAGARTRFTWPNRQAGSSGSGACEQLASASNLSPQVRAKLEANFDCAQLTIDRLELRDEGQYRCEITFSESLDMERCPATTLSQLSVIAQPRSPELLVNGRQVQWNQPSGIVKEGGQVRLECQSSGGRPAPRIEWLNISHPAPEAQARQQLQLDSDETQVRLMRSQWPQKRTSSHLDGLAAASASVSSSAIAPTGNSSTPVPLTSSSVTFALTRYDLQSQFACLVVPQTTPIVAQQPSAALEQLIKSPSYLNSVLNQRSIGGAMLRWTKLDVQVKPSSVKLLVRDALTERLLAPVEPAHLVGQTGATSSNGAASMYSLQPNHLYAVQCIVEGSRPQSKLTWFNRTSAVALEPQVLEVADFVLPQREGARAGAAHRLTSFERTLTQPDGTFRTTATLLLSTNVHDNLEELFCRVSNEAFQFDELIQVAPIISAQLYVNYAAFAWLEPNNQADWRKWAASSAASEGKLAEGKTSVTLNLARGSQLNLRCFVAANPLNQNAILQIEWLKDNRKLVVAERTQPQPQQQQQRLHIEKANHLHMPTRSGNQLTGLTGSNKLFASSQLTVSALSRSDSGAYTCHFKLIPAPPAGNQLQASSGSVQQTSQQQQQQIRITSGQANQTIQVNVIEAKPKAPMLKILSSSGLLVYGAARRSPPVGSGKSWPPAPPPGRHLGGHLLTVVASAKRSAQLSLKCHFPTQPLELNQLSHKVTWYLNGAYLHSATADTYNLSLAGEQAFPSGQLTCAHHILGASSSPNNFHGSLMRVYQSANAINLRRRVAPRLLTRRRQLMPTMRSFSELELSANSANKLALTCLARCEPLCSIGWLLNGSPLSVEAAGAPIQVDENLAGTGELSMPDNQTQRTVFMQRLHLKKQPLQPLDSLVGLEHLIYLQNSTTTAAWLRETYLSSEPSSSQWLKRNNKPLLPELHRHLQQTEGSSAAERGSSSSISSGAANVVSKLELTYNQLSQLLARNEELLLKCRLIPLLDAPRDPNGQPPAAGFFQYAYLEAARWFPADDDDEDDYKDDGDDVGGDEAGAALNSTSQTDAAAVAAFPVNADYRYPFAAGNEPLNLTVLQSELDDDDDDDRGADVDNESHQLQPTSHLPTYSASSSKKASSTRPEVGDDGAADEMQISILLDRAPKSARLLFAGVESTDQEVATVTLTESQLLELADPNRPLPLLLCHSPGKAYPAPQFRWTFTDLNHTFHPIGSEEAQLNMRQFIEFHQRQLNVDPMSAYGVDVLANIAGNYTCTVSNIHGSVSVTLELQIQGRPICKLSLGSEYLSSQDELMVNLRCSIYSKPPLLETIWFRNSQQLATNRSSAEEASFNWLKSPISIAELPVMVLNKQQDFMLADLMTQTGNSKCIARNSLGYSEACELKQIDKQVLLRTFKPLSSQISTSVGPTKTAMSIMSNNNNKLAGSAGGSVNYLANGSINHLDITTDQMPLWKGVFAHLDWLLMAVFALALIWLLFVIVNSIVRRRYGDLRKLRIKANRNTNWRFKNDRTNSNNQIVEAPFQSKMCVNYYGGSNGCDSEHDMIQSCSQSSHYEEFTQSQLNQQRLMSQQQPVYFNAAGAAIHSTLNRRPLKSSVSTSSAGDNSTASLHRSRLNEVQMSSTVRNFAGNHQNHYQQAPKLAANMRESLVNTDDRYSGGITLTSNVPIINGTHNSRINLDQQLQQTSQRQQQYRFKRDQQTFSSQLRNEHIYDDIIYNQIIL